ncbi:MAG: hypothetical protein OEM02_10595, partial [Desulfobulbaceae bacterium]|nr:hypothetical protein [Desulfobulbaceae bacterium]
MSSIIKALIATVSIFIYVQIIQAAVAQTTPLPYDSSWYVSELTSDTILADVSFLNEKPAGIHGFLQTKDNTFVFEDSMEIKFWGIALSAGACFPDKKDATKVAARIASLGFNMVRLHHMDAPWAGRGLIDYKNNNDSRHFNYKNWDRLDYFINELKMRGIYIFLDLLVSRKFRDGDGIKNSESLPYDGKGASLIDPLLIDLQKEYAEKLWTHLNPYTGLRYKNDPVFALCLITNENDLTTHFFLTPENTKGHPELAKRFRDRLDSFAKSNGLSKRKTRKVWESGEGRRATTSMMQGYFREMHDYLKRIGVKVPITGTNWAHNLYDLPAMAEMDFMDQHIYGEGNNFAADYRAPP